MMAVLRKCGALTLWLALTFPAQSQNVQFLEQGTKEAMIAALSTSPGQFGCSGSVTMDIPDIRFGNDSVTLLPAARQQMDKLASVLNDQGFMWDAFVIEGHASASGSDAHNLDLSQRRAQAVVEAMKARGISEDAITWHAYGERRLLYPHDPDHPYNRRVTVRRVTANSAIGPALSAVKRGVHQLVTHVMIEGDSGAYWADTKSQIIDRGIPIYLCVSASRAGLLFVEIREEGEADFAAVGSWPLPEGGLVRVPDSDVFRFTGTPRWQDIRLRHIDCSAAACPSLPLGGDESLIIAGGNTPPQQISPMPINLPDCTQSGVFCEIIRILHE